MSRSPSSQNQRSRSAIVLLIALAIPALARADVDGDRFRSNQWRVRMTAPKNWQISEQTSYPNVLLWMVRRSPPGKMLLSAEKQPDHITSLEYANRTAKVLETLGFEVRQPQLHPATGAYWVDFDNCPDQSKSCKGKTFLRQAYLVANGIAYALTLSAPDARTRGKHLRAFDYALRSIRLLRKREASSDSGKDESSKKPAESK